MSVNGIKYSPIPQTLALKKGNWWIGTGDVSKGPTQLTDYWAGISPPSGGYSVYLPGNQGPNIYTPANDGDLITLTNQLSSQTFTSGASALNWYNTQSDKMVMNIDYPALITDGLVLQIDAGFTPSFPKGGTSWYDLGSNGTVGGLMNGPVYNPEKGGNILLDGSDDYVNLGSSGNLLSFGTNPFTINLWIYSTSLYAGGNDYRTLLSNYLDYNAGYTSYFYMGIFSTAVSQYNFRFLDSSGNFITNFETKVPLEQWVNLTATRSGNNLVIYKNGSSASTASISNNFIGSGRNVNLGGGVTSVNNFKGNISMTQIYNKALSSTEVLSNYQSMFPRFLGENIVTSNLVFYVDAGYSPSYGGTGTAWNDVSGYNNNGLLSNGAAYTPVDGGAIAFDGSDDNAFFGNPSVLNITKQVTLEAWVYVTNLTGAAVRGVLSRWAIASRSYKIAIFGSAVSSGSVYIDVSGSGGDDNYFYTTQKLSLNTWYQIVGVYTGSSLLVYINGVNAPGTLVGTIPPSLYSGSSAVRIGSDTDNYFQGNIAISRIYNAALTSDQILQNFNAQKSRFGL